MTWELLFGIGILVLTAAVSGWFAGKAVREWRELPVCPTCGSRGYLDPNSVKEGE